MRGRKLYRRRTNEFVAPPAPLARCLGRSHRLSCTRRGFIKEFGLPDWGRTSTNPRRRQIDPTGRPCDIRSPIFSLVEERACPGGKSRSSRPREDLQFIDVFLERQIVRGVTSSQVRRQSAIVKAARLHCFSLLFLDVLMVQYPCKRCSEVSHRAFASRFRFEPLMRIRNLHHNGPRLSVKLVLRQKRLGKKV